MKLDEILGIDTYLAMRDWPLTKEDEAMYAQLRYNNRLDSNDTVTFPNQEPMNAFDAWVSLVDRIDDFVVDLEAASGMYWMFIADTVGFFRQLDNDRVDGDLEASEEKIRQRIKLYIKNRVEGKADTFYRIPENVTPRAAYKDFKKMNFHLHDAEVALIASFGNPFNAVDLEGEPLAYPKDDNVSVLTHKDTENVDPPDNQEVDFIRRMRTLKQQRNQSQADMTPRDDNETARSS